MEILISGRQSEKESYTPVVLRVSHWEVFVCIGSRIPPEPPRATVGEREVIAQYIHMR